MSETCSVRNLNVLAYSSGFTLWRYDGAAVGHNLTQLGAPGYFAECKDMLAVGDHIHIGATDGGALAYVVCVLPGVVVQFMGMAFVPPAHSVGDAT